MGKKVGIHEKRHVPLNFGGKTCDGNVMTTTMEVTLLLDTKIVVNNTPGVVSLDFGLGWKVTGRESLEAEPLVLELH